MPLYSDSGNYYYSGGSSQLYSPYYSSGLGLSLPTSLGGSGSSPSSYSSSYNRSYPASYMIVPLTTTTSRSPGSYSSCGSSSSSGLHHSSRYQPKLTTITETGRHSGHSSLMPLTRIQSPKYVPSSSSYTPVSTSSTTASSRYIPPRPIAINTADIDVSSSRYHRRQARESEKEPEIKPKEQSPKKQESEEEEPKEETNDETTQEEKTLRPRRSTIKRNRAVVRLSTIRRRSKDRNQNQSQPQQQQQQLPTEHQFRDLPPATEPSLSWRQKLADELAAFPTVSNKKSPGELLRERFYIHDGKEQENELDKSSAQNIVAVVMQQQQPQQQEQQDLPQEPPQQLEVRRLSLVQCPTFHDICEDISSDKIDDDLNAGELRRRASLIQEQEQEILNKLQKSNSGSFQLIHLERRRSSSHDEADDISSSHSATSQPHRRSSKQKRKSKKVRHKITAIVDIENAPTPAPLMHMPSVLELNEDINTPAMPISPKPKFTVNVETIEEHHQIHKVFKLPKKKEEKIEPELPEGFMKAAPPKAKTSPLKKPKPIKEKEQQQPSNIFTFDEAAIEQQQQQQPQEAPQETVGVATPKPIRKALPKSESGEDFWSQIGSRETLYMNNRKKALGERQEKETDLESTAPATPKLKSEILIELKSTTARSEAATKTTTPTTKGINPMKTKDNSAAATSAKATTKKTPETTATATETPKTLLTAAATTSKPTDKSTTTTSPKKTIATAEVKQIESKTTTAPKTSPTTTITTTDVKPLTAIPKSKTKSPKSTPATTEAAATTNKTEEKTPATSKLTAAMTKPSLIQTTAATSPKSTPATPKLTGATTKVEVIPTTSPKSAPATPKSTTAAAITSTVSETKSTATTVAATFISTATINTTAATSAPKVSSATLAGKTNLTDAKSSGNATTATVKTKLSESTPALTTTTTIATLAGPKINNGQIAKSPEQQQQAQAIVAKKINKTTHKEQQQQQQPLTTESNRQQTETKLKLTETAVTTAAAAAAAAAGGGATATSAAVAANKSKVPKSAGKKKITTTTANATTTTATATTTAATATTTTTDEQCNVTPINADQFITLAPTKTQQQQATNASSSSPTSATATTLPTATIATTAIATTTITIEDDLLSGNIINSCDEGVGNNLSKFATVSNLAQCLRDVDADLEDYIPSSAEDDDDDDDGDGDDSSYDSSSADGCENLSASMKKKQRKEKKKQKLAAAKASGAAAPPRFDPHKKIKIDTTNKCYVKEEAPRYPLVATPRPLWKREKIVYSDENTDDESNSLDDDDDEEDDDEDVDDEAGEEEASDDDDDDEDESEECSTSSHSSGGGARGAKARAVKASGGVGGIGAVGGGGGLTVTGGATSTSASSSSSPSIIRMSTCSNDSGFEGGTAPSSPKKMLVDDFHFLAVLGKGSFGKVLLAELRDTTYYYAIKCLKKDVVLEDDDVDSTLIERKVLALGTKHPYLCHLFCTFQTESHLFFVMEYLNGGDLMFHIQESGRFSEERARFYGAEIISGLKFLHKKGIIYRDLKLDNVLLDYEGHVRIADFGMCKLQIYLDKTADSFCGTPDYMAPEIIKGEKYNQNVDWWSFGVLLYEMLIGQSPFSGCDEDELFWSICNEIPWFPVYISAEATGILKGLLEKDYTKRIGSQYSPAGDISDHIFFRPIDWNLLEKRQIEPPFKPQVKHPLDTQYFDRVFTRERVRLTPIDKEILASMDQKQFHGFTYTNPHITLD
ncbi:uncharacterized protein Pkcdelta isoform X2 [Drosophila tropicalis]|uniref:uncharacterized protein Pkcdelta isoform X2 n=1 Tax=Drosophila tropicalis TaxID=46794 RepID=UPI0035AB7CD1